MRTRSLLWFLIGAAIAALFSAGIFSLVIRSETGRAATGDDAAFIRALDLRPFDRAAVWHEGRLKSFDAFAVEMLGHIGGRNRPFSQPADFTLLDLIFRADRYAAEPIILVKNKGMRAQLAAALEAAGAMTAEQGREFIRTGLIAEPSLAHPASEDLLARWSMDVVRTAKHADAVQSARTLRAPEVLIEQLRMIPPPSGRSDHPWLSLAELWQPSATLRPSDSALAALSPDVYPRLRATMAGMVSAWRDRDAERTNAAVAELASALAAVAPADSGVYPDRTRMALQSLYAASRHMTWVWLVYLVSVVLLLMAVAYRWERARLMGMGFFAVAFLLHTLALGWRWYVAGRWPNSNMFEAVTTSVWLGTLFVLLLEYVARRSPMRNLFALGGAAASMCALMAAHYIPQLNASINNMMPVLHDLWLYIHTNVIIASYALIAMAAVTATLYLGYRAAGGTREYARVGGAAALMEITGDDDLSATRRRPPLGEVFDGATMVLMELSFVMLWAGIIMGAIWADHSWGRPWGWDPKEVFALNTFLVFLILVHVRLKARDKALWTAILALIGCGVMLFNWIVINFIISGLHSYA